MGQSGSTTALSAGRRMARVPITCVSEGGRVRRGLGSEWVCDSDVSGKEDDKDPCDFC